METKTAVQKAVDTLANAARLGVELGLSEAAAVDMATESAQADARQAIQRLGHWAMATSTEQLDTVMFYASVAADAADGAITRPSVGNVRQAVFTALHTQEK